MRREDGDAETRVEDGDKRKWMSTAQLWVDSRNSNADPEVTYVGTERSALNCGNMLRECIKYPTLTKYILESSSFELFFEYVELPNIASDALNTFKAKMSLMRRGV